MHAACYVTNANDADSGANGMAQTRLHARILKAKAPRVMATLNPPKRVTTSWWLDAPREGFTAQGSSRTHGQQMTTWGGVGSGMMKR
jgi:hypothetical protein